MGLKHDFKILKSIWAFVSAILYIADIVFDALQCKTYHDFAYESTEDITVSKWYFLVSLVIWAGPPVLLIMFWFLSYCMNPTFGTSAFKKPDEQYFNLSFVRPEWDKRDLELELDDNEDTIKRKTAVKNRSFCAKMFAVTFRLFWYLLSVTVTMYVWLPLILLCFGGLIAMKAVFVCDFMKDDESTEEVEETNEMLKTGSIQCSFLQLFEHIGEATPQFVLAVFFYYNHYDYISAEDFSFEIFGFLITQTLISMILSAISILKGIIEGIKSCCKLKAWKTSNYY